MAESVYLDYNATTPLKPEVRAAMLDVLDHPGNASSIHKPGREARAQIEEARRKVAALVNARPDQVVFTSGATEANNMVIKGCQAERLLISAVEHSSVRRAAPEHAEIIPVDGKGLVDLAALEKMLGASDKPVLVSIMYVNNETGIIQPIAEIAKIIRKHSCALFYSDAVQAAGRIRVDIEKMDADLICLSGHKMAGPQGAGALILRKDIDFCPLLHGGFQEKGRRSGTENVPAIVGLGVAAELAARDLGAYQKLEIWRDRIETEILKCAPGAKIIGKDSPRVANTTVICLPGISAETQLMALDLDNISVGSGSACSSGSIRPSPVLKAMGYSDEDSTSLLRISLGWKTQESDINAFLNGWEKMYRRVADRIAAA